MDPVPDSANILYFAIAIEGCACQTVLPCWPVSILQGEHKGMSGSLKGARDFLGAYVARHRVWQFLWHPCLAC